MASSRDGFCTFIHFEENEIGVIYEQFTEEIKSSSQLVNNEEEMEVDNVENKNEQIGIDNITTTLLYTENIDEVTDISKEDSNSHQSSSAVSSNSDIIYISDSSNAKTEIDKHSEIELKTEEKACSQQSQPAISPIQSKTKVPEDTKVFYFFF